VATRGNQRQIGKLRKPEEQAKTVALGCDRLPNGAHGKERVDGSSPSEGFTKAPQTGPFRLGGNCTSLRVLGSISEQVNPECGTDPVRGQSAHSLPHSKRAWNASLGQVSVQRWTRHARGLEA
jgi:hypothetical protein